MHLNNFIMNERGNTYEERSGVTCAPTSPRGRGIYSANLAWSIIHALALFSPHREKNGGNFPAQDHTKDQKNHSRKAKLPPQGENRGKPTPQLLQKVL
jgi:hypothetical protein